MLKHQINPVIQKYNLNLNYFKHLLFCYIDNRTPVLAICGCSGNCKSISVELICKELGIDIIEWTDDNWEIEASTRYNVFANNNSFSSMIYNNQDDNNNNFNRNSNWDSSFDNSELFQWKNLNKFESNSDKNRSIGFESKVNNIYYIYIYIY